MIDPKTDTLWKTYLVYFLVLVFGIAIIAKIIVVQTKDNKELVKLAEQREYRVDTLEASRGNIFSADGQLMATTIPLYDVFFDYKAVDSVVLAETEHHPSGAAQDAKLCHLQPWYLQRRHHR